MRRTLSSLLTLALISFPVWGAEIRFDPEPRLAETFRVVVTGVLETEGRATLLVLRTRAVVEVSLTREGDLLRSDLIRARRPCDPLEIPYVSVQLGDTIVAATELGDRPSATARVGSPVPRPDEPSIVFERFDSERALWIATEDFGPGVFRIVFRDRSLDATCEHETITHRVAFAGKEFDLPLKESQPASGVFVAPLELALVHGPDEPLDLGPCDQGFRLTTGGVLLAAGPVPPGAYLRFGPGDLARRAPLSVLPVALTTDLAIPVGCLGTVRVTAPEKPDEVRWCVDGVVRGREPSLVLLADRHRTVTVVALVRKGPLWGRAETTVQFIPRVKLTFLDAETGRPATKPWPHTRPVMIQAEHVTGEAPVVIVGSGFRVRARYERIALAWDAKLGVFLSRPLDPLRDFGAGAGNVLWAQFGDPAKCDFAEIWIDLE